MNGQWFSRSVFKCLSFMLVAGLVFQSGLAGSGTAGGNAGEAIHPSTADIHAAIELVVTNTNMILNGGCCGPSGLLADPGPDGISYAEAVSSVGGPFDQAVRITFDPSLSGAIIDTSQGFNSAILADNVTIDGDLNDDGIPDITLSGNNADGNGIWIWAASHVLIEGLILRNFGWGGIRITNDVETADRKVFEDIVIRNNEISGTGHKGAIDVMLENVDEGSIQNIEIIGNTILDDSLGVNVEASTEGKSYNEISHLSIISNTITGGIIIQAAGGFQSNTSQNTVTDVEIRGNQISELGIILGAANRADCDNNTIQDVVIAENRFDVSPVGIEVVSVGENGWNASGNQVMNIVINDNELISGGIQIGGATGPNSNNNIISGTVIDRNRITSCAANGIFLIAGDTGAHDNQIVNTIIRNSVVVNCLYGAGVLLAGRDQQSPNNTIDGVKIVNLTLVNNGDSSAWAGGLNIDSKVESNVISGVTISNTILWENKFGDALHGSEMPDSVSHSILNDVRFTGSNGNIYEPPEFVDPPTGDYRLQPGSPGVDSGDPLAANTGPLDLEKMVRVWDGDGDALAVVDRGAWEYGAIQPQEIEVRGNDFSIRAGDMLPVYWNGTDFGTAGIGGTAAEQTFTLQNTGSLTLTLGGDPKVAISGAQAGDFSVSLQPESPLEAGESTSFMIAFAPSQVGLRSAVVSIQNNDLDENPFTFAIEGTGAVQPKRFYAPLVLR